MIKDLLIDHIKNNVPDSEVAVLLSGGVDSISVALAAHHVGKKVHAYSFYIVPFKYNVEIKGEVVEKTGGGKSYDFITAEKFAKKMNWGFTEIEVPTNKLVDDYKKLAKKYGCRKKTHFECLFPFLYVYSKIKNQKYVLTGWGADGYFGPSKKASMRYVSFSKAKTYMKAYHKGKAPRVTWNEFRSAYLDGDCAGLKEHTNLAIIHDKIHVTPYLDSKIRELLWPMNWTELNKPRQKEPIRSDFTELEEFGIIKPHQNLHLNAGIDKLVKTLLNNDEINFKERKRMMDVCWDWYKKNDEIKF